MSGYGVTDQVGFLLLESDLELRSYLLDNYTVDKTIEIIEWTEGDEPELRIVNDHGESEVWSRH